MDKVIIIKTNIIMLLFLRIILKLKIVTLFFVCFRFESSLEDFHSTIDQALINYQCATETSHQSQASAKYDNPYIKVTGSVSVFLYQYGSPLQFSFS